jgi:hypothetical protein
LSETQASGGLTGYLPPLQVVLYEGKGKERLAEEQEPISNHDRFVLVTTVEKLSFIVTDGVGNKLECLHTANLSSQV